MQQGGKTGVRPPRPLLHIAVNGLQCLRPGHHRFQGLICRDARQELPLKVPLLFPAGPGVFPPQDL